jgi:Mg/Co/Ni transporter MgtE
VYDYTAGKLDWLAAGLPTEGTNASHARVGDVARRDAPTCEPDERIGDVRTRVSGDAWEVCVVVNAEGVVFGLLRAEDLAKGTDEAVNEVMRPGPSTFRPFVPIEEMAHRMIHHDLSSSPITTSDGRLVGVLLAEDAVRVAHEQHAHHDEGGTA